MKYEKKEIHFFESFKDAKGFALDCLKKKGVCEDVSIHVCRHETQKAIADNIPFVLTTDISSMSLLLITDKDYHIYLHQNHSKQIEIKIGNNEWTDREIKVGHNIEHMFKNDTMR